MTASHRPGGPSDGAPAVANVGAIRPPLVYGSSILIGTILDIAWPLPFLPLTLARLVGSSLVVVAVLLFASSVRQLWTAGTPVPGNKPTTVIVRTGPYRVSRNPIYLAFSLLHLGIAIWANSPWLIVTLIATLVLMVGVVIPREERYLEGRFGSEYVDYRRSVRRWL